MADIERKYVKFSSIKCTGDPAGPGGFEGHTSIAGNLDDGGDIILDGAFKDVIAGFLKSGFTAHSHDWNIKDGVIGYPMEAREDKDGLFVSVKFHSTDDAQNVRTKMRERIADGKDVGLSIGYRPQAPTYIYPKDYDKELPKYLSPKFLDDGLQKAKQFKFVRVLTKMGELKETSVVTSPMNTASQVNLVKDSDGTVKAGARNSAGDARKIQAIHDMAAELHPEVCSGYQAGGKAAEPVLVKEVKDIFDDSLAEVAEISPWGVWDAFSKTLGKIKLIKRAAGDMNVDTTGMLETALTGLVTALRSAAQNELDDADTEILPYAMYGRSEAPERKASGKIGGVAINDLPDTSFAYIEKGGDKDDEGKTTPRALRHYPYRDKDGNLDEAHVRAALSRLGDPKNEQGGKSVIEAAAAKLKIGEEKPQKTQGEHEQKGALRSWEVEKFRTERARTSALGLRSKVRTA